MNVSLCKAERQTKDILLQGSMINIYKGKKLTVVSSNNGRLPLQSDAAPNKGEERN